LQVANVLFSVLKLRHPSNDINIPSVTSAQQTKGGKHKSTSEEDLLRIVDQHPLVQVILSHRHVSKVLHTFIEGMQTFIADDFQEDCASTRRLYASWNQVIFILQCS
jgi:DNA polymerase-1